MTAAVADGDGWRCSGICWKFLFFFFKQILIERLKLVKKMWKMNFCFFWGGGGTEKKTKSLRSGVLGQVQTAGVRCFTLHRFFVLFCTTRPLCRWHDRVTFEPVHLTNFYKNSGSWGTYRKGRLVQWSSVTLPVFQRIRPLERAKHTQVPPSPTTKSHQVPPTKSHRPSPTDQVPPSPTDQVPPPKSTNSVV